MSLKRKKNQKRVVLVTGGSGDIGRTICRQLSQDGYQIAVHYYSAQKKAETLARELNGFAIRADLSKKQQADSLVKAIVRRWGRIDALVNVAGLPITKENQFLWDAPFEKTETSMYIQAFQVDTLGTIHAIQSALPFLKKSKSGRIVNFVSTPAVNGHDKGYPFTAAKGAVLSLTKSLALEFGPLGITINAIALGTVETHWMDLYDPSLKKRRGKEIPMRRIGHPSDVASLTSFLVSPECAWMTGQFFVLDGGEVRP